MKNIAVILLVLAGIIFTSPLIYSQSCGDIKLIADYQIVDDPADLTCDNEDPDCFRIGVPVYFQHNGAGNPLFMDVCTLTVSGEVTGGEGVEIDYTLSNVSNCEGELDFDNTESGNSFEYTLDDGDVDFGSSSTPTFILFIKARPGEDIFVDIQAVSFYLDCGATECILSEASNEIIDFDGVGEEVTKAAPGACSENVIEFELGTAATNVVSSRKEVPIEITHDYGAGFKLDDYDLVLYVDDLYGNLEGVDFHDENSFFDVENVTQSGNLHKIYLASESINKVFAAGGEKMGDIWLYYPSSTDAQSDVEIYFDYVRVFDTSPGNTADDCCAPDLSHDVNDVYELEVTSGDAVCGDYSVELKAVIPTNSASDCDVMFYDVIITGNESDEFAVIMIDIEFEFSGDAFIGDVFTSDIGCGNDTCTDYDEDDCFKIEGDVVKYGFCDASGYVLFDDPAKFRIAIDITDGGCVESIKFNRSRMQEAGQTPCSLEYTNIDTKRCFEDDKITGTIEMDDGGNVIGTSIVFQNALNSEVCHIQEDVTGSCGANYCGREYCSAASSIRITPENNTNITCGVTTFDLVLITQHILGLSNLDSPYKLIAADANNSGAVSTLDMVFIQKVILGVETSFPNNNTSWRFVDEDYTFPTPTNPWSPAFPENVTLSVPIGVQTADFIGVKIGDVNETCDSCNPGQPDETPDATIVNVKAGDDSYSENDTVTVTFQTDDDYDLVAYQMGFSYDMGKLTYLNTVCHAMPGFFPTQCAVNENKGEIRILSYDSLATDRSFTDSTTIFELNFIANQSISSLDSYLTMDSTILPKIAYDSIGTHYSIDFEYVDISEIRSLGEDEQDWKIGFWPNPVGHYFNLGIDNYPGGAYQIQIFNSTGQQILARDGKRNSGFQKWRFNELNNFSPGIYFLNLRTSSGSRVVKFIKQ